MESVRPIFEKELSQTDTSYRLSVPMKAYREHLERISFIEAIDDGGRTWKLKLNIRRNGPEKPEITGDWLPFVNAKGLNDGGVYRVILSQRSDQVNGVPYTIKAERKIFNTWAPVL